MTEESAYTRSSVSIIEICSFMKNKCPEAL